jgi:hypothetical protein
MNTPRKSMKQKQAACYLLHACFLLGLFPDLEDGATFSSKMSVDFESTTRRYIQGDRTLQNIVYFSSTNNNLALISVLLFLISNCLVLISVTGFYSKLKNLIKQEQITSLPH